MDDYPLRIVPILTILDRIDPHDEIYHLRHTSFFATFFRIGRSSDGVWMVVGRPSYGRRTAVFRAKVLIFKFQISNFNWPGLGRDGSERRDSTAVLQPWPIEIWNLKIEIYHILPCESSRPTIIWQPSNDNRNTVRRPPDMKKNCEKRSMSQMIDLVMRINSVQKSSKSELSSRGKRPFKVFIYSHFFCHRR